MSYEVIVYRIRIIYKEVKRILITGAGSYIGTKVEEWLKKFPELFSVDSVDTLNDNWKSADFSKYDVVYNVAGIAHVKAKKSDMRVTHVFTHFKLTLNICFLAADKSLKDGEFIDMEDFVNYPTSTLMKKVFDQIKNNITGRSKY